MPASLFLSLAVSLSFATMGISTPVSKKTDGDACGHKCKNCDQCNAATGDCETRCNRCEVCEPRSNVCRPTPKCGPKKFCNPTTGHCDLEPTTPAATTTLMPYLANASATTVQPTTPESITSTAPTQSTIAIIATTVQPPYADHTTSSFAIPTQTTIVSVPATSVTAVQTTAIPEASTAPTSEPGPSACSPCLVWDGWIDGCRPKICNQCESCNPDNGICETICAAKEYCNYTSNSCATMPKCDGICEVWDALSSTCTARKCDNACEACSSLTGLCESQCTDEELYCDTRYNSCLLKPQCDPVCEFFDIASRSCKPRITCASPCEACSSVSGRCESLCTGEELYCDTRYNSCLLKPRCDPLCEIFDASSRSCKPRITCGGPCEACSPVNGQCESQCTGEDLWCDASTDSCLLKRQCNPTCEAWDAATNSCRTLDLCACNFRFCS